MNNKVFLGGTCNNSKWRDELIPLLKSKNIEYFNPVVKDWNAAAQAKEELEKEIAKVRLYVITPKMTGVFSIAEVVDDSNKLPKNTILCIITEESDGSKFDEHQLKSLKAVNKLIKLNGASGWIVPNYKEGLPFIANQLKGIK